MKPSETVTGKRQQMRDTKDALRLEICELRDTKDALRLEICELRDKIKAALSATRVPDRVIAADVYVVRQWKDGIEKGSALNYHIQHAPHERSTAKQLTEIRSKLQSALRRLT